MGQVSTIWIVIHKRSLCHSDKFARAGSYHLPLGADIGSQTKNMVLIADKCCSIAGLWHGKRELGLYKIKSNQKAIINDSARRPQNGNRDEDYL